MSLKAALAAATSIVAIVTSLSEAVATPISLSAPSLILSERSANDIGKATGERIVIINDGVMPNSAGGTTGIASTVNISSGATVTHALGNNPNSTVFPDQFNTSIPYNPNLVNPWTLSFTNGANTATSTTPSLVGVTPIPFASNVTVSGSSANPTFSWVYPAGSVDGTIINIYQHLAGGGIDAVYATTLAGVANSFTVPTALGGGLSLTQGSLYTIDIYGVKLRNSALPISNPNSQAWSEAFFDFTPLPAGSPQVNLPLVNAAGAYQYSMTVIGGQTYFIDPKVAIGYRYAIGVGNPDFASVLLPAVQASPFDVSFLDNGKEVSELVDAGVVFDFPGGGVNAFTVTGISPADGLNPADTTAFVTGLTFAGNGLFTGTQTPIVASSVPEPTSLLLLATGLIGLRSVRPRTG